MKRLKELREAKNLTQSQVARDLNMPRQSISHYEKGDRQPDYEIALTIARYYGVTVDYLLGGDDAPEMPPAEAIEYKEKRDKLNALFGKMTPEERDLLLAVAAKMRR